MENAPIAFVSDGHRPALEIRINFGIFAGRAATSAELDDLARQLLEEVEVVSVVAEDRHEVSAASEASLHQVRVEVPADGIPPHRRGRQDVTDRLLAASVRWARHAVADRHAEVAEP